MAEGPQMSEALEVGGRVRSPRAWLNPYPAPQPCSFRVGERCGKISLWLEGHCGHHDPPAQRMVPQRCSHSVGGKQFGRGGMCMGLLCQFNDF